MNDAGLALGGDGGSCRWGVDTSGPGLAVREWRYLRAHGGGTVADRPNGVQMPDRADEALGMSC